MPMVFGPTGWDGAVFWVFHARWDGSSCWVVLTFFCCYSYVYHTAIKLTVTFYRWACADQYLLLLIVKAGRCPL